jgi:hypothetical protein
MNQSNAALPRKPRNAATTAPRSGGYVQRGVIRHGPDSEAEQQEREANLFAMCLLMPEDFVWKEIKRMGGNFDIEDGRSIKQLAEKFKVSVPVMTLRLGQLSERLRAG